MAERQFIIFKLEDENYCSDVVQVRSITDAAALSKVPGAPGFIEGLLNLRGEVIPIINLKKRFGLTQNTPSHRIIISYEGIGFLVDDASKSMTKDEREILAPPMLGVGAQSSFVSAIAVHEERLVLVIDLHTVVSAEEIKSIMS